MTVSFFKPTKRKVFVWTLLSLFFLLYIPMIQCRENVDVAKATCTEMSMCKTDYYSSIIGMMINYRTRLCPADTAHPAILWLFTGFIIAAAYAITCAIDHYYEKYRNK
ncbi:MAG: hypothetical protein ABIF10_08360 [Candidatus Woesearchaeota archaeon]